MKAIVCTRYGPPDLLETGNVVPVIDRRYPLSQVAEALSYLEEKHAKGKIVITVEHGNEA